ncbi:MAG: metallophosphatase domain-containing protein [Sporocytophaga sp.]|uniref:metallophosphatase domain-containing protein n=1 Tax=Sporocytophaga sp. TaxID=2231183 RepID=UPI001B0D0A6E|nr:metallophosphatase domain-containing protein [Sporocytophaga sp.]MBO9702350.1 metallophosphatase domain-containing protein [Sporocytophaga sp.]
MKFVIISDTHGEHRKLTLPKGDVLIHAGDISRCGEEDEVLDFLEWFKELNFEHRIFIAGNHDFFFEKNSEEDIKKLIPSNVTYLCDSGITIEGIKVWGSPVTPWFYNWAFNRHRGEAINRHWELIPIDTDIIITHGPVLGILDQTTRGQNVGCKDLLNTINAVIPKVHICGHIHEAYGQENISGTMFINAAVVDVNYLLKNEPIIFEL